MDLRQYLHAVRTYWWAIAIPALLGIAAGIYSTETATPKHRAAVTFFITTGGDPSTSPVQGDEFAQRRLNSYLGLLDTDRLANMVIESAELDLRPRDVRGMIGARGDIDTVLITATVTSASRQLALTVAEAVAPDFPRLVREVESSGSGDTSVNLEVVSGPNVGVVATKRTVTVGMRAALGLILGVGLALLLELRDNAIRSDEQLQALGMGPVLGTIPFDRRARDANATVEDVPQSLRAEAFRQLRTNLEFIDVERPVRVLVVTSSVGEEGKSSTCANLALTLVAANRVSARSRERGVLVVEGDLRRPTMSEYFPVDHSLGLTDVVIGRVDIDDVLQPWGRDGLWVLPSGHLPPNPSELLGSDAMGRLLDGLRHRFDAVIINTPPLLPVTDAALLAAHADGVVVVVRAGKTSRHQLTIAMRSLYAVGARFLGTVLNMVPVPRGGGYAAYTQHGADGMPARPVDVAPVRAAWDARPRRARRRTVAATPDPSDPSAAPSPGATPSPQRAASTERVVPSHERVVPSPERHLRSAEPRPTPAFEHLLSVSDPEFADGSETDEPDAVVSDPPGAAPETPAPPTAAGQAGRIVVTRAGEPSPSVDDR
jgi:capsular exopolysaccharide synthesis family protein